ILMAHGDDILFGNEMHHIENKTVLFEHEKVDILTPNHRNGSTDCMVCKDRGTLLRKLHEQNLFRFAHCIFIATSTAQQPQKTQGAAHKHADPSVDELQ